MSSGVWRPQTKQNRIEDGAFPQVTNSCSISFHVRGTVDDPDAPKKEDMDKLVTTHATRQQVESAIGCGCTWYADGTDTNMLLHHAEGRTTKNLIQSAIGRKQNILHHTTSWQQTYMVFDKSNRIESYWFTSQ